MKLHFSEAPIYALAQLSMSSFMVAIPPKDVITPKYLKDLSRKIPGDTWRRLGLALDLSRTKLQAISGKAAYASDDPAYTMLMSWVKRLPISSNRVSGEHRDLVKL